jgi:AraC-like DNA-binding protein
MFTPLGRYGGYSLRYLAMPRLILKLEDYRSPLRVQGLSPAGMLALSAPIREAEQTAYWKMQWPDSGFHCMMPGVLDGLLGAGQRHFLLLVSLPLLQQQLPEEAYQSLVKAAQVRFLPAPPPVVQSFRDWLFQVLREVRAHPEMLYSAPVIAAIEKDLIERLVALVAPPFHVGGPKLPSLRGLYKTLDYLSGVDLDAVSIPDLCKHAGLSHRALTRHFRTTFDLTPTEYLRLRRLHAARRCLLASRKGETTVAAVAYQHGFYELGRFAIHYANRFGERPSATLAAEPRSLPQTFLTAGGAQTQ